MSQLTDYYLLEGRHVAELDKWIKEDDSHVKEFTSLTDRTSVSGYVREMRHRFAITACVAQDMEHPDTDRFWTDYQQFHDLEEMF